MTYLIKCPACQQEGLDPRYSPIACIHCKKKNSILWDFAQPATRSYKNLSAALSIFFCNTCNELISKKKVDFHVSPASPAG